MMARVKVTDDLFSISFSEQSGRDDEHIEKETRPYYMRINTQINSQNEMTFYQFEDALRYLEILHKQHIVNGWTTHNTGDGRNWSYYEGGYSVLGNNQSIYIGKTLAQELYMRSKLLKSDELLWVED